MGLITETMVQPQPWPPLRYFFTGISWVCDPWQSVRPSRRVRLASTWAGPGGRQPDVKFAMSGNGPAGVRMASTKIPALHVSLNIPWVPVSLGVRPLAKCATLAARPPRVHLSRPRRTPAGREICNVRKRSGRRPPGVHQDTVGTGSPNLSRATGTQGISADASRTPAGPFPDIGVHGPPLFSLEKVCPTLDTLTSLLYTGTQGILADASRTPAGPFPDIANFASASRPPGPAQADARRTRREGRTLCQGSHTQRYVYPRYLQTYVYPRYLQTYVYPRYLQT